MIIFSNPQPFELTFPNSYIILFLLTFLCYASYGQRNGAEFEYLSTTDGLIQNHVYCVNQDKYGFMWFCTQGGLAKYDGYTFTNFLHDDEDSSSISSSNTYKILIDTKDRYWVTTSRGLNLLDRAKGTFRHFLNDKKNPKSLGDNITKGLLEDKDGFIWIVHSKGVDRFDPATETFEHYYHETFAVARHSGNLCIGPDGTIWVQGLKGLYKVRKDLKALESMGEPEIKSDVTLQGKAIFCDANGLLWLGYNQGLATYDSQSKLFKVIHLNIASSDIATIIQYTPGSLAIGTMSEGLLIYDSSKNKIATQYNYSASNPNGIIGSSIYFLFIDKDQNLWLGLFWGISRFNEFHKRFRIIKNEDGLNNLRNFTLLAYQDKQGGYWMNTMEGLFYRTDINGPYTSMLAPPRFVNGFNDVKCIEGDTLGRLYIYIGFGGLFVFDQRSRNFDRVTKDDFLGSSFAYIMRTDVKDVNTLWIGTIDGICKFNKVSLDTFWYRPDRMDKNLKSGSTIAFDQRDNGQIVFVIGGKLCILSPETNKLEIIKNATTIKGIVRYIHLKGNLLWIATGTNFYIYDLKGGYIKTIKEKDGVSNLSSSGMRVDHDGIAWNANGNILSRVDINNNTIDQYETETRFISGTGAVTNNGDILFAGSQGTVLVSPKHYFKDTSAPKVIFTGLDIANEPISFDKQTEFIDQVEINYAENVFTIHFAALHFVLRDHITYRYQLIGFDEKWMSSGKKRFVTYTNLRPGKYIFRVEAINEDGISSTVPMEMEICIIPPFYLTYPFFALILIAIGFLIFVYVRIDQKAAKLNKKKELAEKNAAYKSLFLANMSHEIRTPMNAIIGLNRLLIDTPLNDKQNQYVKAIHSSSENLLWIVNDILDQAKIESGKYTIAKKPFEPMMVISQLHTLFDFKVQEKDLKFDVHSSGIIPKVLLGDQVRLFQILTNLISNAIKFTREGEVVLNMSGTPQGPSHTDLEFKIQDSGIGIPEDKLESIFESFKQVNEYESTGNQGTGLGLSIVKNLVEQLGGKIEVNSTHGKGSTFHFSIRFENAADSDSIQRTSDTIKLPEGLRILLVEDAPLNQLVAVELLKKYVLNGVTDIAENGLFAIEKIKSKNYDLILMDVKMPVMNGIEATQSIRDMDDPYFQGIPILGLTANAIAQQIDECLKCGMNDCITKPIDANELVAKIAKYFQT